MHRFALLAVIASVGAALGAPRSAVARTDEPATAHTVTTSLTFVDPGYAVRGDLRARFKATDLGDGTWSVDVTFKPQKLSQGVYNDFSWIWYGVYGTASATATATTGAPLAITAPGLHYTTRNGVEHDLDVKCTFTVGADGVVTVQSLFI